MHVIRVWLADYPFATYDGQPFLDPMRRRAAEFEAAHPEYRIDVRGYDFWTMAGEVSRAASEGDPPHVAGYYATDSQLARDALTRDGRPLFTSVQRAVGGRTEILGEAVVLDDIVPAARDYYTVRGDLTSVPVTATTTVLYTNTTLLRAAGVAEVPRTWAEVSAACEALGRPITWANHGWLFQQAVGQQGGLLADNDNGRSGRATIVDLASPQLLAWAQWWQRLHAAGHYLYTGNVEDWMGTFVAFATQRAAFAIDSSKAAEEFVQAGQHGGFEVAVSAMPHNADAPYAGNAVSGDSLWLADGLDEATRDGALAFIQYLLAPRSAAEWHRANGFLPITGAAFDALARDGWFDEKPHQRVAVDVLAAADGSPAALGALLGNFEGVNGVLAHAMHDVLTDGADPVARFTRATADAQRLLDEYASDKKRHRDVAA